MANAPRVSIIMPCFNAAATVERAINSVLAQTFTDFELIIVNDASTDNTVEIITALMAGTGDARLKLIDLQENLGPSGVRNEALRGALGTFVAFLDSDDEFLPEFLHHHVSALPDGFDISMAGHFVIRPDGSETTRHSQFIGQSTGLEAMREAMLDNILPFAWDKVYRRTLFEDISFPEGSTRFEDMTINILLDSRARLVTSSPTPLNRYYISSGSLTWGRIPSRSDSDLALADLHEHLPEGLRAGKFAKPYATMRLLITLIVAQSAIMKLKNQPAAQATVDDCRKSLKFSWIFAATFVKPKFAAAALLLKAAPATFAKVYLKYSAASYGLE
ncbi:glycosyl transferase family protein [Arthrobacter sp. PAMC 25486]|uniref:glycosyltransferase family 2 protein n=1 Tax=Arthrobacter sp. PAMC 25486 TaxID=1494608 RepID=UPI000535B565|nr:glycosyltransferase family 2 protein [Arthrobacter sp. PAMC 25486]AIY01271.1 glycosyl transferase family protein [Arthrobacter sp. PAMC 25486]